jgi:uncharacterized protein YjbI with pentapeptide repeats
MKLIPLGIAGLLIAVGFAAVKSVPNLVTQWHVQQLLGTKACPACNLRQANLQNTDLERANLQNADLEGANLKDSRLKDANLQGANLRGANLEGANLGCTTVNFDLKADNQRTTLDINVDEHLGSDEEEERQHSNQNIFRLNLDADQRGATLTFNLQGCANLRNADLRGARLPNGEIHP